MVMEYIEIDSIEVSDSNIDVTYWLPGFKVVQQLSFKTSDFEEWLTSYRNTSVNAYWDHWDSLILDEMRSVILYQDMKQYLGNKWQTFNPAATQNVRGLSTKKPMTKVSNPKKGEAGSESA